MRSFVTALLLAPALAAAQAPSADSLAAQRAAIERIDWLVGEWEGAGTFDRGGPQGKAEILSWERVTRAAGGTALMIVGRHYQRQADGSRGALVHDAAALITFDAAANRYRFQSQLASGQYGAFSAETRGTEFVWGIETQRGLIRYRIVQDAEGRWSERGEMCAVSDLPDAPCRDFFSMTLRKTGKAPN